MTTTTPSAVPTSLSALQAGLIAFATQIVAFLVSFGVISNTETGIIVSAATALVNTGFLVANAIHDMAASKVKVAQLEAAHRTSPVSPVVAPVPPVVQ